MELSVRAAQDFILNRLQAGPSSHNALRVAAIRALGCKTELVEQAVDALAQGRDVEVFLEAGCPMLRLAAPVPQEQPRSTLVELPGPTPEERAKLEAWNRLQLLARIRGEMAAKQTEIREEEARISDDVKEEKARHKTKIDGIKAILSGLEEELEALEAEVSENRGKLEALADDFAVQRAKIAAKDPEGAKAADRIGKAKQQSLAGEVGAILDKAGVGHLVQRNVTVGQLVAGRS